MTRHPSDVQRICEWIHSARRILMVTHVAPDGDAIGSMLGLAWLLSGQGKELTLACEDPVPRAYAWLPGSGQIVQRGQGSYDLLISLDCSDVHRMGRVVDEGMAGTPLLNIDHHITNTRFGVVNWVDPSSVATAQMILVLADIMDLEVTQPAAVCLLNGLVTDTRSFRTSNVDTAAIRAALRLMEAGASLSEITWRALDQRPFASIRLWGEAIGQSHLEDGILWTSVTRAMRRQWALDENGGSGLVNFLSGVREAKVVILFTERQDGTIDVGMRAVPSHDVAQVAVRLGGGGHPQASGCTLEGDLAQVRERVLTEVRRSLAEHGEEVV
jgi:phosphoesterase RecJ-like protein